MLIGNGEGGGLVFDIRGGGGGTVMQKRQSPDFRSPEVGISAYDISMR